MDRAYFNIRWSNIKSLSGYIKRNKTFYSTVHAEFYQTLRLTVSLLPAVLMNRCRDG